MQNTELKKIIIVISILLLLLVSLFTLRWQRKKALETKMRERISTRSAEVEPPLTSPTKIEEILPGVYQVLFEKGSISVGESVKASISFTTTDSRILSGSDVILSFDPVFLEAEEDLTTGDYFESYPRKLVDNTKGVIKVTAFGGNGQIVSTPTTLFIVTFKGKKSGTTTVSFDFVKGRTNLTTLVEKGTSKNILGQIVDGTITIEP